LIFFTSFCLFIFIFFFFCQAFFFIYLSIFFFTTIFVFPQTKSASKSAAFSLDAVCGADQSCKSRAQRLCA